MNVKINTDHNIQSSEALIDKFSSIIKNALSRMSNRITSVQVHMSDEDGNKKGLNDKRCKIEARLEGHQPIVVIDNAETLNQALDGAIDKLIGMIDSILGRQQEKRNHNSKKSESELKFPEM